MLNSSPSCFGMRSTSEVVFKTLIILDTRYFHQRSDNEEYEARTVFCAPSIQTFNVTAQAYLQDRTIAECNPTDNYTQSNNVTGAPLFGRPFNACVFCCNHVYRVSNTCAASSLIAARTHSSRREQMPPTSQSRELFLDLLLNSKMDLSQHLIFQMGS